MKKQAGILVPSSEYSINGMTVKEVQKVSKRGWAL